MYKYVLNSVVKISMMFAKYFEYYTVILRGGAFFRGHAVLTKIAQARFWLQKARRKKEKRQKPQGRLWPALLHRAAIIIYPVVLANSKL